MNVIVALRAWASRFVWAAEGRARTTGGKKKGQDKRACHECRKSLTGLAFSRAWRSVVCRFREFVLRFQCFGMHGGVPRKGRVFA
jgi:hypothetical protein